MTAHAYEMGGSDAVSETYTLALRPERITRFDLMVNGAIPEGDTIEISKGQIITLRVDKQGDIRNYNLSYDAATLQRPKLWDGTSYTIDTSAWLLGETYTITVKANSYAYGEADVELQKTYSFKVKPDMVTKFNLDKALTRESGNVTVDVDGDIKQLTVTLDGSTVLYSGKPESFPCTIDIRGYAEWDFETEHRIEAKIELYENGKTVSGLQQKQALTLVRQAEKLGITSIAISGSTLKNGIYLIDQRAIKPTLSWTLSKDYKRVEIDGKEQSGNTYTLPISSLIPGQEKTVTLTVYGYGEDKEERVVTYALRPNKLTSFSLEVDSQDSTSAGGVYNIYRDKTTTIKWNWTGDVQSCTVKLDGKVQPSVSDKKFTLNTAGWNFNETHTVTVELKLYPHGESGVQTTKTVTLRLVPRNVTGVKLYVNGAVKSGNATVPRDQDVTITWSVDGDPKSVKLTVDGKTEDVSNKTSYTVSKSKLMSAESTVSITLTATSYEGSSKTVSVTLSRQKIGITKVSSLTLSGYTKKDGDVYVFDKNAVITFEWVCDGDVKKAVIDNGMGASETLSASDISSSKHKLTGFTDREPGKVYTYTLTLTDYAGKKVDAQIRLAFKPQTVTGFTFKLDNKTYANGAEIHVAKGNNKILSWSISGEAYLYKVRIGGQQVQSSASTQYQLPISQWAANSTHDVEIEIVPYDYADAMKISNKQKVRVIVDPDPISGLNVKLENANPPETIVISKSEKKKLSWSVDKGDADTVSVTLKQGSVNIESKTGLGIGGTYTLDGSKLNYGSQYTITVTVKGKGGDELSKSYKVILKPEALNSIKIKIGSASYTNGQEAEITKPASPTLNYSVGNANAAEAYNFEFKLNIGNGKTYKPGDKLETSGIDMNKYDLTLTATPKIRTSGDKVYTVKVTLTIKDSFEVIYDTSREFKGNGSSLSPDGLNVKRGGNDLTDDEKKNVSINLMDVTTNKVIKKFDAGNIKWSRSIGISFDDPNSDHNFRFDVYYNGIEVGSSGTFKIVTKKQTTSYTLEMKQSWDLSSTPTSAWVIIPVDAKYSADQVKVIELFKSSKGEKEFTSLNIKTVEVKKNEKGEYEKAVLWNVKSVWSEVQHIFGDSSVELSLSCKMKDEKNYNVYALIVGKTEQELRNEGIIR